MDELAKIYKSLSTAPALLPLLAEGADGVLPDLTDYSGRYPVVVYSLISAVPALFADDEEAAERLTVQISIVTEDGADADIVSAVLPVLAALGWMRYSISRITDGDKRVTALRFVLTKES